MGVLAWKNLFYDKVRLAVTLVGVVFSLVLMLVQFGLFLNFVETAANVVDRSGADLWLSAPDIPHVNAGTPLLEANRWKALQVPGVERVDRYILAWVPWKLPSGSSEAVMIVGFSPEGGMGRPWNIVSGSIEALKAENAVMVDELYLSKLGVKGIGDTVEISGRRAKIVGLTHGIRSFTTSPYIFTSFKNALNYTPVLQPDETIFFLVKTKPGADIEAVKRALQERLPNLDVYTNREMSRKTQVYWVLETGAGVTTMAGALLGLVVGIVVVAQTIYAATVDHIREFGTLKAIGATNGRIYQVILLQAALSAAMGYAVAISIAKLIADSTSSGNVPILLPPEVAVAAFIVALAMCMGASVISIRKATRIDPALVFRG